MRSLASLLIICSTFLSADPLPSWNDGASKASIIDFVTEVTDADSEKFITPSERIAVFDNDGNLWPENPAPFQLLYVIDALKEMVSLKPELKEDPMVAAAVEGNVAALMADHHKGLIHVVGLTHTGMTAEEFSQSVEAWISSAKHPRFGLTYDKCVYQPMLEVLSYLRANDFKTYIVSGGGADFMRPWTERVYGIPPEQVVGSRFGAVFEVRGEETVIVKTMDEVFIDDKAGKPVGIHQQIGRRPVMAFGNSDGDKQMLEYTTMGNLLPSFGMIIHHTDAEREYAYDKNPKSSGKLVEALADAPRRGWIVVDMKKDWNVVIEGSALEK